ncbi:MAG: mechanosensitive ion channel [Lachnospiraceae bacterium]|nr:mechanosensitive ion channel [Lachnospiraceae bacterium]MBQ9123815.1 mechanosensitive ion channel [Lachnospiraceae bacterium]
MLALLFKFNFYGSEVITQMLEALPGKLIAFGLRVLFSVAVFFIGSKLIKLVRKILKRTLTKADAEVGLIQFLDSFAKMSLYILLVFTIATTFGVDAASVIALIGSAGVAIGLALQGSLSNFAGGVLILLLKPFVVGDYIKEDSAGNEGTVSEIQLFYTKLRTGDNKIIVLPNGTLANTSLTNYSTCEFRRLDLVVGISYDADVKLAKSVLEQLVLKEEKTCKDKEMIVYVDSLASSSVDIAIRCWVKNEDYWEVRRRLTEEMKYVLEGAGIPIPFPQMDVHVKNS